MKKRKNITSIVIAFLAYVVLSIGRGFIFSSSWLGELSIIPLNIVIILTWWVALVPVLLLMKWGKTTLRDLGFAKEKKLHQILLGIVAGVILAAAMTGILELFSVLNYLMGTGNLAVLAFLIKGVTDILTVGLVEEMVFRGYIFRKLLDVKDSRICAVIVSSLLFGLSHFINLPNSGITMTLIQVGMTTLLGFIFSLSREKLKYFNMLTLIIFHAIYDAALPFFTAVFGR